MLIYSNSFESYKAQLGNTWNLAGNPGYRDIAFTADGKIITHGIVFNAAVGSSVVDITNIATGFDSNSETGDIIFNLETYANVTEYNAAKGTSLSASDFEQLTDAEKSKGKIEGILKSISALSTGKTISITDYVLNTSEANIDSKGRITSVTQPNGGVHLDYVTVSEGSSNAAYPILFQATGTRGVLNKSTFTFNPSTGTFTIPDFTKFNDGTTSLTSYINSRLLANDAMVFAGTVDTGGKLLSVNETLAMKKGSTDLTNTYIGSNDTYISEITNYVSGWTFKVASVSSNSSYIIFNNAVEVGDMVIAVSEYDANDATHNTDWTVVQANIDGSVTAASTLTANEVILGNGNKTVKTLANPSISTSILSYSGATPTWKDISDLVDYSYLNSKISVTNGISKSVGSNPDSFILTGTTYKLVSASGSGDTAGYTGTSTGDSKFINLVSYNGTTSTVVDYIQFAQGTGITSTFAANKITINLLKATNSSIGGVKLNQAALGSGVTRDFISTATGDNSKYYPVQTLNDGTAFVDIPWLNTWRAVKANLLNSVDANNKGLNGITGVASDQNLDVVLDQAVGSIGTNDLKFGKSFCFNNANSTNEIDLVWMEITGTGANDITYTV